jgi:stage II sporulation protein AA (anti-sigma F factor antagonist)
VNNYSLSSRSEQDISVMMPKGYINNIGAENLASTSEKFIDKGSKKLVVNFSEVQFINTIGLSIFLSIVQNTLESKGLLCFTNMKKDHREMFEMAGLIKHVKVFKDEKDALNYLNGRS